MNIPNNIDRIYSALNDRGLGYSVGHEGDGVNDLAEYLGADLIQKSTNNTEPAVYRRGDTLILVGDAHGPWAVEWAENNQISVFRDACVESNTAQELDDALAGLPDQADMDEWLLTPDGWRQAIREALDYLRANAE